MNTVAKIIVSIHSSIKSNNMIMRSLKEQYDSMQDAESKYNYFANRNEALEEVLSAITSILNSEA